MVLAARFYLFTFVRCLSLRASAMKMSSLFALAVFGLASSEAMVLRRSQSAPTSTLPPMAWMRQHLQKPEVFGTGGATPC